MNYCIEAAALTYHYSSHEKVLDNVSLRVPEGSVYGFLGPNGAGKTTTLKLLLGLLKNQSGSISIFNKNFREHRTDILRNTGSLIEMPSLYSQLTAAENLEVLRKIYDVPKSRIGAVLELVGLGATGKKKAGAFSLGMKQRLSIALALLHNPKLLILDEPTNGLDPNGIIEIRNLLRELSSTHNITILVSSHLLAEVEKLVTHVGIIGNGKMRFEGTLKELMQKQHSGTCTIAVNDVQHALAICAQQEIPATVENDVLIIPQLPREQIALLNRQLVNNGVDVYAIANGRNDLESIFMHLTNN
jgi:ABC-2 type transport system ATP-binding protein